MIWKSATLFTFGLTFALVGGCKDDHKHTGGDPKPAATTAASSDDHADAVSIGETKQGNLTIQAKQDKPLKPGGETAFDVVISGYPQGQKPKAVRFWVGVESGDGSVKARADEEKEGVWHTHVDVPSPLPEGAKFWCEIEPATGEKFSTSFTPVK